MERLWETSLARPRAVLMVALGLALALLPGTFLLESDNTPNVFVRAGSAEADHYRDLRATFGSDEALRIVARGARVRTAAGVQWLADVGAAVGKLHAVRRVIGLPPAAAGGTDDARWAALVDDSLLHQLGVVARGGEVVTLLVLLDPLDAGEQARLLRDTERLFASAPPGISGEVVGMPVLGRALDAASREVEWRYFPILVLVAAGLLAVAFRRASAVVLPLVFVALAEVVLLGPMGYADVRLNMVLSVLPPLVLVIALALAVYVQVRFHDARESGGDIASAVREAYRAKRRPLVWTSVTTLVGFGALLLSDLPPVRSLGLWCLVATAEMLLLIFAVYPALLLLWARGEPHRGTERVVQGVARRGAQWAIRRRVPLLVVTALLTLGGLLGLPRLRVEGNALTYLPPDSPARAGIERLEAEGVGLATVEMMLDAAPGERFDDARGLERLSWLAVRLREETPALGVVGVADFVDAAVRRSPESAALGFAGGGSPRPAALARMRGDAEGAAGLASYLTRDGTRARLTLFVRTVGLDRLQPLLDSARAVALEELPQSRAVLTGQFPLLLDMQRGLLETLAGSLGLTLLTVALVFFHLLRSFRYTPLALVTSLVPVIVVLGAMSWVGVPLDIATVMIASIVLGLAGDDTIHTVDRYRELALTQGRSEAVVGALERNAPAYVLTALIRVAGFGICALSGFVPIHRFGLFSALAIALATLADLFVVAALLGGRELADP